VVRSQVCSQPGTYAFFPIFSGNPDWPVMPATHVCIGEEAVKTTSSGRLTYHACKTGLPTWSALACPECPLGDGSFAQ
jgi:hypothetical protein